jgi:hypothetical protein
VAEVHRGHAPREVVEDLVAARESLPVADAARGAGPPLLLRLLLRGGVAVGALPREEVPARASVLLNRGAARREDELAALDGDYAADHVDGRDAGGAVVARLAHDAEGPGAEAGLAAVAAALAQEADVLCAADAGLALALLRDLVECIFLDEQTKSGQRRADQRQCQGVCEADEDPRLVI